MGGAMDLSQYLEYSETIELSQYIAIYLLWLGHLLPRHDLDELEAVPAVLHPPHHESVAPHHRALRVVPEPLGRGVDPHLGLNHEPHRLRNLRKCR